MRRLTLTVLISFALAGSALAVSVFELSSKCGDDGKAYCEGVSYGDAMQDCLNANYKKLSTECKLVMDRVNGGEKVSIF